MKTIDNINYLKENGIDVDSSLELLGDKQMYDEILLTFKEENISRMNKLKKHLESDNLEDYAILVHSLKSDSKYLGFKTLAELAYDHELNSKDNNKAYIQSHFEELNNEVNRIMNIINKYI